MLQDRSARLLQPCSPSRVQQGSTGIKCRSTARHAGFHRLQGKYAIGAHLLAQQAQQQVEAALRPELRARALRGVRHAAQQAHRQRPQRRPPRLARLAAALLRKCIFTPTSVLPT